jgi:hypothetical protein
VIARRAHAEPWVSDPHELGQLIDWKDSKGPSIGTRLSPGVYHLLTVIAVTHTENGQRANKMWERWDIDCTDGISEFDGRRLHCQLEQLAVNSLSLPQTGPLVSINKFSTFDNTITNVQAHWEDGRLDFSVVQQAGLFTKDATPMQVEIRFNWTDTTMHLLSLHAVASQRDGTLDGKGGTRLTSFDYSVPEYSFAVNVPMTFQGMNEAGVRLWREMERSLSSEDQAVWADLAKNHKSEFVPNQQTMEARMKAVVPNATSNSALPAEQNEKLHAVMAAATVDVFRERLGRSTMSRDGQMKIVAFLSTHL